MRSTSSSLALRALFKSAAHRAGVDKSASEPTTLTGLSRAAVAFHAALRADDGPLLVIVPTDADVEQMVTDARFFHGALSGATDVDTRAAVRALPSQEVDPYRGLAPHLQIASVRAASRRSRIITAHLT